MSFNRLCTNMQNNKDVTFLCHIWRIPKFQFFFINGLIKKNNLFFKIYHTHKKFSKTPIVKVYLQYYLWYFYYFNCGLWIITTEWERQTSHVYNAPYTISQRHHAPYKTTVLNSLSQNILVRRGDNISITLNFPVVFSSMKQDRNVTLYHWLNSFPVPDINFKKLGKKQQRVSHPFFYGTKVKTIANIFISFPKADRSRTCRF